MVDENIFLFHAFLLGIFVTFVYDLVRIFRRVVVHNTFFMSLEDLIFWIYCGTEVFLLMYHESDGTLRWFAVLGAFAGMFLYRKTAGPILVTYVSRFLNWLKKLVMRPMVKLHRAAGRKFYKGKKRAGSFGRRLKRSLKIRLTYFMKKIKMNLSK